MNKRTYNIFVIGCQMNISDSERIAFSLENLGYKHIDDIYKADLAIITTCGVKQGAEDRIYGLIPAIRKASPDVKIILTGCLSGEKVVKQRLGDLVDIWMPIIDLENIASILGEGEKLVLENERDYLKVKAKYQTDYSAFVPIGNGCDNFCSYCYVPYARGREVYRDFDDILNEVKELIKKNYKEITLIAQNVNSFRSGDHNFAELLKTVNDLEGDFWLRFSTSHPKDMSDELIETLGKCDKLCHHIHLPAQAGDNEILEKMNRKYTREHYLGLIEKIRKVMNKNEDKIVDGIWNPPVAITTDIIVGFPGESEEQFRKDIELFEEVKYDMAYISEYSPRPGTLAAKMKDLLSEDEKKNRNKRLNNILSKHNLENNKEYKDKVIEVLIERKTNKGEWVGKTKTSKTVIIENKKSEELTGKIVKVKIKEVKNFGLYGKII